MIGREPEPDELPALSVEMPAAPRTEAPDEPAPGYSELRRGLISLILGMGSYYVARYLGAAPLVALMTSTAVSTLRVGYTAMRTRRLDPIAAFLLAADGVTAAVGLASRSSTIVLLGQHIPGVIFEVFVIFGLLRGKPITESMINWFRPGWVEQHIANHAWNIHDAHDYHRTHMRLTTAVAVAQMIHLTAATVVILTLPVDIAKGLVGTLALSTDAVVLTIAIGGVGNFLRHRITRTTTNPDCNG